MAHERLRPTFQFDEERLQQLRQIAPEAFADGKINWETLRAALGDYSEEDNPDTEHFGLFWPGKRHARQLASLPSTGTLVPAYGEGLIADGTPDTDGHNDSRNIFIEEENLKVLKLLQKSYAGCIKMIYIDPPYNTGNDGAPWSLYVQVQVDSDIERHFVERRLNEDDKIVCYFKFPSLFKVQMPKIIGNYNPDWGIIQWDRDGKLKLELVRETKGASNPNLLQYPNEKRKIDCAGKHFQTLGVSYRHIKGDELNWWESNS